MREGGAIVRARRVGVVSEDSSLFVDLALRGEGLEVSSVDLDHPAGDHDVVLLDLPPWRDAAELVGSVPEGPAIVVLADETPALADVTVVLRPCSVGELIDALLQVPDRGRVRPARAGLPEQAAGDDEDDVVIVLDELAPAAAPATEPLFTSHAARASRAGRHPSSTPAAPAPAARPESEPGATLATALVVARLREELASTATVRAAADTVAGVVREAYEADHVALWLQYGAEYRVLGAAGLTDGARGMHLPHDHPVLELARADEGTLVRDANEEGGWAPGLPGSASPTYAMVLLHQEGGPADLLTISGPRLDASTVEQVRGLVLETGDGWPAAEDGLV